MENNDIVITRDFACSQQMLFDAWNKPEQIEKWYGPKGFNTSVVEYNFAEGGKWKYVMKGPDGREFPVAGTFEKIDPPNKVVSRDGWDDEPGSPGMTAGMSLSVDFEKIDESNTRLTLTIHLKTAEDKAMWQKSGAVQGYESSFARIDEIIKS